MPHTNTRLRQTRRFLEKGNKVKFTMRFRGREVAHIDLAYDKMREIATSLAQLAKVEQGPEGVGMQMHLLLAPLPKATTKKPDTTPPAP